jgi:hypothetical protein
LSRTAWYLVSLTVLGLLVLPSLAERLRAVRRAVGAVAVYWVSLNLWGSACYALGLISRVPQGAQIAWVMGPPLLVVWAWRAWGERAARSRP